MMLLAWSDDLLVNHPVIDRDHEETIELLNTAHGADDAAFPAAWQAFYRHLVEHFAREEGLMEKAGFPAFPVHKAEHERVLELFIPLNAQVEAGAYQEARDHLEHGVVPWFKNHRDTMDFVTAQFVAMAERSQG
ncbi:MAG: bacteriohemerythrin [Rhodospirillaceae bacterium]